MDPDLREYRRQQALSALATRYTPKKLAPLTTKPSRAKTKALFAPEVEDANHTEMLVVEDDLDPELLSAIQESLEDQESEQLRQAIEASKVEASRRRRVADIPGSNAGASSSRHTLDTVVPRTPARPSTSGSHQDAHVPDYARDPDDDLYASPTRLETALSIGNAGPKKQWSSSISKKQDETADDDFGTPTLLVPVDEHTSTASTPAVSQPSDGADSEDDYMEEVDVAMPSATLSVSYDATTSSAVPGDVSSTALKERTVSIPVSSDEEDMEEIIPTAYASSSARMASPTSNLAAPRSLHSPRPNGTSPALSDRSLTEESEKESRLPQLPAGPDESLSGDSDEERWSRPASPTTDHGTGAAQQAKIDEDWDAAQEMNPQAEENEYAQFISQVRGRNLEEVRREIDDEIRILNEQKKIAMRDSEDITHQMISQIMVCARVFGYGAF